MLRVTYSDTAGEHRWNLCGTLAGPWVDELRSCWRRDRDRTPRARALVDLTEVTFIDEAGECLLAEMRSAGAEFVADGVENKDVIAALETHGSRALRRAIQHLRAARGKPETYEGGDK